MYKRQRVNRAVGAKQLGHFGIQTAGAVHVGAGQRIGGGGSDLSEGFILHRFAGNQRHVARRGIVVIVMQAAGIDKMRIGAANGGCVLIHRFSKSVDAAADGFGD